MSSFVAAIGDLFSAILNIFHGIFNTITGAISAVISVVINFITAIFNAAEGVVGFLLGNIFIIAVIGAAFVGYRIFVQNKSVAGVKKTS